MDDSLNSVGQDFWAELAQTQAESIGWIPFDEVAYLHVGSDEPVIPHPWTHAKRRLTLTRGLQLASGVCSFLYQALSRYA